MNRDGHAKTLVAAHPENLNAVKSGVYSRTGRVLTERAQEVAESLMTLPHVHPLDSIAAEEIGTLVALSEAIDADLAKRGRSGPGRKTLLENKARLGRELRTWLREFGGTPKARAEWAARLTRPTFVDVLADIDARRRDGDE